MYSTNNTKGSLCATAYRTLGTDEWSFKYYRYDARGRVIKMWNYIAGLGEKSTEYSYNSQNQITDMKYENEEPESKKFKYTYDYAGRLQNTSFDDIPSASPDNYLTFNSYAYNQNSQINTFTYDPISLIYTSEYDTRNRITMFSNEEENPFSYSLEYFANSNIQTQTFSGYYKDNFSNQYDLSFDYSYDESNRLLEANCTSTEDNTFDMINSYDPDGNILTMQRYGSNNNLFDNYNYAYYAGTNRLRRVSGTTDLFTYDYNGNMTNDYMNNNTGIKYDHRNLITEITNQNFMVDPPRTYITRYRYDEAGKRTRKTVFLSEEYDPPPLPDEEADLPPGWTIVVDDYYSRDVSGKEIGVYSSYTLQYWNVWSGNEITGRINYAGNSKYYYLKDHLGSIRAVLDEGKTVISANDYDMWGYYIEDRAYETTNTKNKFTGKERDNESTYDYFGARYYDSRVGRWGSVDPLFEKHIQWTPYNYVLSNTLKLVDPNGKQVIVIYSGYGLQKQSSIIDPKDYSAESSIGAVRLMYFMKNYLNSRDKLNSSYLKGYYSSFAGIENNDAKEFIKESLSKTTDKRVFLYGYSTGGINILSLAKELSKSNISVSAIAVVDAYGVVSNDLSVSENVEQVLNIRQRNGPFYFKGLNINAESRLTTIEEKIDESSNHFDIDENTIDRIINYFKERIEK